MNKGRLVNNLDKRCANKRQFAHPTLAVNLHGAPTVAAMITGGTIGGVVNDAAQRTFKLPEEYSRVELIGAIASSALTFGKGFVPSVLINSESALISSYINNENPTGKLASTVVGTWVGGRVGGVMLPTRPHQRLKLLQ